MLIDMIHDNHGEPPFKTRYRDPATLRAYGYQAIVIPDALAHIPAAYQDGLPIEPASSPLSSHSLTPRKPADIEAAIDVQVQAALARDMKVYFYGDALLLPRHIVDKNPSAYLCDDSSGRLCPGKPTVFEALADQVHELFDRWPHAAGLVMRTGEVYPEATPHMVGSPLHAANCPTCRPIPLLDRLTRFIQTMHDVVITELHKTYIHRAWQPTIPGLPNPHDNPATYRDLSARLPPPSQSPSLAFSFKFTRGDFRQDAPFNPCLLADDRPKWIEFQCEREYEGKGAFPNFQAPQWQRFFTRLRSDANLPPEKLADRFALWGWSRGGGWGGPYVQREEWIDANVYALAELFKNSMAPPEEIATAWTAATFGIAQSAAPTPAITELLMRSASTIHKLLYVTVINNPDALPWLKDDLLDVNAIWSSANHVVDAGKTEEAIAEKREALQGADRVRHLFDLALPDLPNASQAKALSNALAYYNSFAGSVVSLFTGFVKYIQWNRNGRTDTALATEAAGLLEHAQAHWQHHTQRHALLPGAPSVFQENTLWDRTNDCLEQLQNASL